MTHREESRQAPTRLAFDEGTSETSFRAAPAALAAVALLAAGCNSGSTDFPWSMVLLVVVLLLPMLGVVYLLRCAAAAGSRSADIRSTPEDVASTDHGAPVFPFDTPGVGSSRKGRDDSDAFDSEVDSGFGDDAGGVGGDGF